MDRIIRDRIISTGKVRMTAQDISILKARRNSLVKFMILAYIPLALVILYQMLLGVNGIGRRRVTGPLEIGDDDISNYEAAAPYVFTFCFLALTIYFLKYFFDMLMPILKDIRRNEKQQLNFKVEKNDMSAFSRYYIIIPVRKNQEIQVSAEDFHAINASELLTLEIAPRSCMILGLLQKNRFIDFKDVLKY